MSTYEYTHTSGSSLLIRDSSYPDRILLRVGFCNSKEGMHIPAADVPTVAAELLKAAGYDNLADLVGWESAEKKLQERRDALAKELSGDEMLRYEHIRSSLRRAINRIIELEDGASRD